MKCCTIFQFITLSENEFAQNRIRVVVMPVKALFRAPDSTQLNQFGKCSELSDWQKKLGDLQFFCSWVESGAIIA